MARNQAIGAFVLPVTLANPVWARSKPERVRQIPGRGRLDR